MRETVEGGGVGEGEGEGARENEKNPALEARARHRPGGDGPRAVDTGAEG
jgi:hypothetical protein